MDKENPFQVGTKVLCSEPGSWAHGHTGVVLACNVLSTDGIYGHCVQIPNHGITILPEHCLFVEGHVEPTEKPALAGLFRENPKTPEGKYLVKRRDGSVVEWPSFVLGARDPIAEIALRAYASEVYRLINSEPEKAELLGLKIGFFDGLVRWIHKFAQYRRDHGTGDPGKGQHRRDDPATVEEMKKGMSA